MKKMIRDFSLRRPKEADLAIHVAILFLMVFSMVMVTSASMGHETGIVSSLVVVVIKQIVFMFLGYCALILSMRNFKLDLVKRHMATLLIGVVVALLIPRLFSPIGGTYAWIYLPFPIIQVTVQPAEFAKTFAIFYLATLPLYLKQARNPNAIIKKSIYTILLLTGIILLIQKDFGSAIVLFGISSMCFLTIQSKVAVKYQKILLLAIFFVFVLALFLLSPIGTSILSKFKHNYQAARFLSAANPFLDRFGIGFQLVTGLISQASGGFTGLGYGNSIRKYSQFPAADTDFILAIVIEELGYFGYLLILIAYLIIIYRLFKYAIQIKNNSGKIILVGTAMYLSIHFILNVGGVSALIPLTGVPLLLVSSGGSSIVALMIALGACQQTIIAYKKGIIQ